MFSLVAKYVLIVHYSQGPAVKLIKSNNTLRLYCRWLVCCQSLWDFLHSNYLHKSSWYHAISWSSGTSDEGVKLLLDFTSFRMNYEAQPRTCAKSHWFSNPLCLIQQGAAQPECIRDEEIHFQRCLTYFPHQLLTAAVTLLAKCSRQASEAAELLQ